MCCQSIGISYNLQANILILTVIIATFHSSLSQQPGSILFLDFLRIHLKKLILNETIIKKIMFFPFFHVYAQTHSWENYPRWSLCHVELKTLSGRFKKCDIILYYYSYSYSFQVLLGKILGLFVCLSWILKMRMIMNLIWCHLIFL